MSKIPPAVLLEAIHEIISGPERKKRNFKESVDLQVNLKNYDVSKDKRFSGSLRLPNVCRPRFRVTIITDLAQEEAAKKAGITTATMEDLKKLNKNKKLVKKFCCTADAFLASDSVIKTIPRIVGPHMNRANKFPTAVAMNDNLNDKVLEIQSTVKFQLKKVLCLGCCVGHEQMKEDEIRQNTVLALNFLVSLLKKGWQNLKSAYIKTTMGKPQRIY